MKDLYRALASKIRYFAIGFSLRRFLASAAIRIIKSRLLYFYLLIAALIFFRGYLPMRQIQQRVEISEERLAVDIRRVAGVSTDSEKSEQGGIYATGVASESFVLESSLSAGESELDVSSEMRDVSGVQKAFGNKEKKGYTIEEFNKLSAEELMSFNGVGKVTAEAIISLRAQRGGFASFEELLDVKGIGPAKLAKILGTP